MTAPTPRYLYKLLPSDTPTPESGTLPVSNLDQQSGFIHLSTALQVPNTLKIFFKDEPLIYVLRIEYEKVEGDIRWESPDGKVGGPRGGEGMFPHLYNGHKLGSDEIESMVIWKNEGDWDHVSENAGSWLTY